MIRFECPHCGKPVEVDDEFAGRRGRCPGCRGVVTIPGATTLADPATAPPTEAAPAAAAPIEPPSAPLRPSVFADEVVAHGPRKLTLPDSITAVRLDVPAEQAPGAGRNMARTSLLLACLPLVSVIGIVLSRVAAAQARQNNDLRGRRTAGLATRIGIIMTLASLVLVVLAMISVSQEQYAVDVAEGCRREMYAIHTALEGYAANHDGQYPVSVSDIEQSAGYYFGMGYYGNDGKCPATNREFGYVTGLKSEPKSSKIVLYDRRPAHGCRAILWRKPDGRNVCRLNGSTEFLSEEEFQRQMAVQGVLPVGP